MIDLVGFGQISLDHVATVAELPGPGTKTSLDPLRREPGGQVATALRAAQRLGLRCALAGAVGDDPAGSQALAPLVREGVDVTDVAILARVPTRQAWVLVEHGSGERSILERRDPALRADPPSATRLAAARALLVDLEHEDASLEAVRRAQRTGIPTILDADRATPAALELCRSVEFPIVSEAFADEISSGTSLQSSLAALRGPRTVMAVVTRGKQGCLAWWDGGCLEMPARPVPVTDTTGAGDVFRGAFVWALLTGKPLRRTLELATSAASLSCRGAGAQGDLPRPDEVDDWVPPLA